MTPQQIAQKLSTRQKGQIYSVIAKRKCKTLKDCPFVIEKVSHYQGMLAEYAARKEVRDAVENKDRTPPELPKGASRAFYEGNAKFFEMKTGNTCMAVVLTGNEPKSEYLKNNKPVDFDEIKDMLAASEKVAPKTKEDHKQLHTAAFKNINVESILEVK